MKLSAATTAIL